MSAPLADKMRPKTLDQIVGQQHILSENGVLRHVIKSGKIPNMIFHGPPGVGKTTVANMIAKSSGKRLYQLNGTSCSTADIKEIVEQTSTIAGIGGIVLYLDEIQYLNKKQQQTLLEFMENGSITLIASTTENPYFYVYGAILSRSVIFEFKPVLINDIAKALERACEIAKEELVFTIEQDTILMIAQASGGDVRKALNLLEMLLLCVSQQEDNIMITQELVTQISNKSTLKYSKDGDEHYDLLSAFQKSIRGSDENAALYYLAVLLECGDLLSICRRLLVITCEDIGLAYPNAIAIVKACVDCAMQLGIPEARIPLAQAVVLLATSPKSNSACLAIDAAMTDVKSGNMGQVPKHLKDGHYLGATQLGNGVGYQYPHNFKNHYVQQQYLPDSLKKRVYYTFGENKVEFLAKKYRESLLKE